MAAHTWKQQQQQNTKYRCHSVTQGKRKKPQSVLVHKHLDGENGIQKKDLGNGWKSTQSPKTAAEGRKRKGTRMKQNWEHLCLKSNMTGNKVKKSSRNISTNH